jgi:hypothetical protein
MLGHHVLGHGFNHFVPSRRGKLLIARAAELAAGHDLHDRSLRRDSLEPLGKHHTQARTGTALPGVVPSSNTALSTPAARQRDGEESSALAATGAERARGRVRGEQSTSSPSPPSTRSIRSTTTRRISWRASSAEPTPATYCFAPRATPGSRLCPSRPSGPRNTSCRSALPNASKRSPSETRNSACQWGGAAADYFRARTSATMSTGLTR